MKYLQIQKDLIGKLHKRKNNNKYEFVIFNGDEGRFIGDGYKLYKIPDEELLLNLEGMTGMKLSNINMTDSQRVHETGTLEVLGKDTCKILRNENFEIAVNQTFFKYFNEDMQYKASGERSPLLCYENEKLVAIIMPIRRG